MLYLVPRHIHQTSKVAGFETGRTKDLSVKVNPSNTLSVEVPPPCCAVVYQKRIMIVSKIQQWNISII